MAFAEVWQLMYKGIEVAQTLLSMLKVKVHLTAQLNEVVS